MVADSGRQGLESDLIDVLEQDLRLKDGDMVEVRLLGDFEVFFVVDRGVEEANVGVDGEDSADGADLRDVHHVEVLRLFAVHDFIHQIDPDKRA